jgi:hypothetical protein
MRVLLMLAVIVFCLLATGQSFAQIGPKGGGSGASVIDRITLEQLASVLTEAGFQSQLKTTPDDRKFVVTKIHGFNVGIWPGGCKPEGCSNLEWDVYFSDKVTLDFVNAWNAEKRFAKAYVGKDGEIGLSMDTILTGGVAPANIAAYAVAFDYFLSELAKFQP